MKKLNKTLLFIIAAIFTISTFTQCKAEQRTDEGGNGGVIIPNDSTGKVGIKIAYVNIERLMTEYSLAKDLNQEMLTLEADMSKKIEERSKSLEKDMAEFQRKYENNAFLSPDRAQQEYQRISNEEAKLQEYVQKLQSEALQTTQKMQIRINDSIQNYVKTVLSPAYDIVLTSGGCLHITESMDITSAVVNDLNARYQK